MHAAQKTLIWDFDGTLAFRSGGWTGALLSVLGEAEPALEVQAEDIRSNLQSGFPWHAPENAHPNLSPDEWWQELEPLFARAFRAAGLKNGHTLDLARKVRHAYVEPGAWQLFDDTLPALEALSRQGWSHVLLTNHVPELPDLLDRLNLSAHFAQVFNSAQTGYEKPNPKAFRVVMDWLGPGASVLMVGDSFAADILGAREAGLPSVLVRKQHPQAACYCESLLELAQFL
jgi:putative hydrolase of the HAD superfamily